MSPGGPSARQEGENTLSVGLKSSSDSLNFEPFHSRTRNVIPSLRDRIAIPEYERRSVPRNRSRPPCPPAGMATIEYELERLSNATASTISPFKGVQPCMARASSPVRIKPCFNSTGLRPTISTCPSPPYVAERALGSDVAAANYTADTPSASRASSGYPTDLEEGIFPLRWHRRF